MHPLTVILRNLKIATLSCCVNLTSTIDIEYEVVMQIDDCRPSMGGDMKLCISAVLKTWREVKSNLLAAVTSDNSPFPWKPRLGEFRGRLGSDDKWHLRNERKAIISQDQIVARAQYARRPNGIDHSP